MADEKLFENRIKKHFHSVGIYPAGYPSDRMDAPVVGWYTKIWGGGFQKSGIPDLICCVNGVIDCSIHIQELIALKNANASTKCDIWTE